MFSLILTIKFDNVCLRCQTTHGQRRGHGSTTRQCCTSSLSFPTSTPRMSTCGGWRGSSTPSHSLSSSPSSSSSFSTPPPSFSSCTPYAATCLKRTAWTSGMAPGRCLPHAGTLRARSGTVWPVSLYL